MPARERARERAPEPARASGDAGRERAERPGERVPAAVETLLLRSQGRPMEPEVRAWMESCFGHDFSRVRVHTDRDAADAARELDAHALARGEHVYFARGLYRPSTHEGRRLLAHELTHTLQQPPDSPRPVVQRRGAGGIATGLLEAEAETAARRVAAGERVPPGSVSVAARHLRRPPSTDPARPREPGGSEAPDAAVRTLAAEVYRILAADPDDRSGQARRRLESAAPATREAVVSAVRARLTPAERARMATALTALATGEDPARQAAAEAAPAAPAAAPEGQAAAPAPDPAPAEAPPQTAATPPAAAVAPPAPAPAPLSGGLLAALGRLFGIGRRTGPQAPDATPDAPPVAAAPAPAPAEAAARAEAEPDAAAEAAAEQAPPVAAGASAEAGTAEAEAEPAGEGEGAGAATRAEAAGASPGAGAAEGGAAAANTGPADRVEGYLAEKDQAEAEREEESRADEAQAAAAPSVAGGGGAPGMAEAPPSPVAGAAGEEAQLEGAGQAVARAGDAADLPGGAAPPALEPEPAAMGGGPAPEPEAAEAPEAAEPEAAEEPEAAGEPEAAEAPEAGVAPTGGGAPEAEVAAAEEPAAAEVAAPAAEDAGAPSGAAGAAPGPDAAGGEAPAGESAAADPEIAAMLSADSGGAEYSGGGGGGGSAIPDPPSPAAPDLSGAEPEEAMAQAAALPPAQMQQALGGVTSAASRTVGAQRDELAASPPEMEAPTGAPTAAEMAAESAADERGASAAPARVERAPAGEDVPVAEPDPLPPQPESPTARVGTPNVGRGEDGELSEQDVREMRSSIRTLPTTDPALHAEVGAPPRLVLEGSADPARAQEQRAELNRSVSAAHAQGLEDVARPAGENSIFPDVPTGTLTAAVPSGGGGAARSGGAAAAGGGGGGGGGAADTDAAVAIIAQEERGDQVRAAAQGAQGEMSAARAEHQAQTEEAHAQAQADIDDAVRENAGEQRGVRGEARAKVRDQRRQWSEAQQEAVDDAHSQADTAGREGARTIGEAARRGRSEAAQQVAEGNRRVATARQEAEGTAQRERRRGEQEGSGFFGWLASRARRFFNSIKEGIQRAFAAARAAVARAIENAQRWAAEKIEQARQAIVAGIRWVGERMIAIGDVLLAGFPTLRDRFRGAIEDGVRWAEERVNELAADLQAGVKRFLDGLGAALNGLLNLLEAGLLAAVDAVSAAVQGAIQFARSVADGLAQFAALIRDVAAGPGQWIANLGAAVVDGIRNHLWKALKTAVKEWFNSKLEEVLGLGTALWNLLRRGGIDLAAVGKMVWAGLKQAIPAALVAILVEKLVAMIVPAAGAVMAIIEGVRAAWGTVSRIIAAFSAFFAFLRAVRGGNAGPQFATAVAAGAVAVIDFVANWLLMRLRRPAGAIAGRIRAIAQRIMQRIGRVLRRVGRALRRAGRRIGRALRRAGRAVRRGLRRAARRIRRMFGGRRRGRGRNAAQRRQQRDQRRRDRERRRREEKQRRLERAVEAIRPQAQRLLARGTSRLFLGARLLFWRLRYRLSSLTISGSGSIVARVNPSLTLQNPKGKRVSDAELGALLLPVFAAAEQAYIQSLLADPVRAQNYAAADQAYQAGTPGSLQGVSRLEASAIVRGRNAPPSSRQRLEPDVDLSINPRGRPGKVENIGAYDETTNKAGRVLPAMVADLTQKARAQGLDPRRIAEVLATPAHQINDALDAVRDISRTPRTKADVKARETFLRQLRRTAVLTQVIEPSRRPGIGTTVAASSSLAALGRVPLEEVHGPRGRMAAMTPVGAAPESGVAVTREQRQAGRLTLRRVGQVFRYLVQAARRGEIIVIEGGYDLSRLGSAVEVWLEQRKRRYPNPEDLIAAEQLLRAEVLRLLNTYHGTG